MRTGSTDFRRFCRLACGGIALALGLLLRAGAAPAAETDVVPVESLYVVEVRGTDGGMRRGSAVAIGRDTLLTNCHVTRRAATIQVGRAGYTWPATVRSGSGELDLCVLSAPLRAARAPRIREATSLAVGEAVYAAGFPVGQGLSIRSGTVRALHGHENSSVIQVSAPFDFGDSGGGLFDRDGNLIGVLTFKMLGGGGYYFALPTDWIARVQQDRNDIATAFWERSPAALPPFLARISLDFAGRRGSGTSAQ